MTMSNPVDQLKNEYESLATYLKETQQISLLSDLNKNFRKILVLSAGSYFEHQITKVLSDFIREKSNNDERIINFLEKQAISKKYHQLFDWGDQDKPEGFRKNVNAFWKLFGDEFKVQIDKDLKGHDHETMEESQVRQKIIASIEAFIEIGHHRNILVHNNFAAYDYDQKTTEEIYQLFQKAEPFISYLQEKLA